MPGSAVVVLYVEIRQPGSTERKLFLVLKHWAINSSVDPSGRVWIAWCAGLTSMAS